MVTELSSDGLHARTHELDESDVRAIEQEIEDSTACQVESAKIMNPPDDREGLHISLIAGEKSALAAELTLNHLHDAAVHVGYDGDKRDSGPPLQNEDGLYRRSFYFTFRRQ